MKALFSSKKFLLFFACILAIAGAGYFIESKAGDEIADRIKEQIVLVGGEFDSVAVSPLGEEVKIEGLRFKSERENAIFDFYVKTIILDGVSLDAIDPDAGDYPLVAEHIEFKDMEFSAKNPYSKVAGKIETYSITNWSQNIALLVEQSDYGYGSLEFLERAFTFRYDGHKTTKALISVEEDSYHENSTMHFTIDNVQSQWSKNDILTSTTSDIIISYTDFNNEFLFSIKNSHLEAPVYGILDPKALALIMHLSLADYSDEYIDEMLLNSLLTETDHSNLHDFSLEFKDLSVAWNKETLLTNNLLTSFIDMQDKKFKLDIKDLDITSAAYEILGLDKVLSSMKLQKTSLDSNFEAHVHEDNKTISFSQILNIDNLFNSTLTASIEMLESLEENTINNTPNKFISTYLAYEDTGFLPRYIKALEENLGIKRNEAIQSTQANIMPFASFLPSLEEPLQKLFKNLGKLEIELTESIGVFDILFIPPANLTKLFNVTYTPSKTTLDKAIKAL